LVFLSLREKAVTKNNSSAAAAGEEHPLKTTAETAVSEIGATPRGTLQADALFTFADLLRDEYRMSADDMTCIVNAAGRAPELVRFSIGPL